MRTQSQGDGAAGWLRFEESLRKGDLSPFYVLFGKERYFIREAVRRLKERILPSRDLHEMLFHSVVASEVSGVELADLARSAPFFDATQLILLWEADKLKEADQEALKGYAGDPAPFTCMVLLGGEETPKGPLFSFLKDGYPEACLGFPALKRAACVEWARRLAKEKGLASYLSPEVLEGLVETGQASLGTMERQLAILALYVHDLEANRIEESLPFGLPEVALQQSYRLTDPLLEGDLEEALRVLKRFVGQGISPLALLSRIAWEIRRLWQVKAERGKGPLSDAFLRSMRIQPFKKTAYAAAAGRVPWGALGELLFAVGESERLLKSSRHDPLIHLEALCTRMALLLGAESDRGRRLRG